MGVLLWLACGTAALTVARIIPHGRRDVIWGELLLTYATALVLGIVATVLDFGGWDSPDWRAGLFVFAGAFAASGSLRIVMRYFSADLPS